MPKYQIIAGKHHGPDKDAEGNRIVHKTGEILDLPESEAAKFENKFRRVEVVEDKPVAAVAKQPGASDSATAKK